MVIALPLPQLPAPESVPPLRWGIVGTGSIAGTFVDALHRHTIQRAIAVTANNAAKTTRFAAEHGISRTHESIEALVSDKNVDVVYVATPHPLHRTVALAAIAAGKSVLVEKPFAMSAADALEVAGAARTAGVFIMEAMWTRYLPQADILRRLLADHTIGDIHFVMADFGFIAPFNASNRMWDPALGGGALLDAGVYPLSFVSSVLGSPTKITATGVMTQTGVDGRATILIESKTGASALVATSMVSALPTRASIIGSEGRIDVHSPFFGPTGLTITMGTGGSDNTTTWNDTAFQTLHEGLSYEATALAHYVAEQRTESPLQTLDETISVLATIDEARSQISASALCEAQDISL